MSVDSDGGPAPADTSKKRKLDDIDSCTVDYRMFTKTNYKRQFPENYSSDCVVYVESINNEKLGNKNPIALTKLFTENVKGIIGVHRVNAHKVGVTFKKPAPANNFLKMDHFLTKNKLKAFVPAHQSEITGVIKYVPKDLSNEVIYKNIACDTEVISIKRFFKKVEGKLTPLGTIAVTFAGTILPQYAYIQMFGYPVHLYIPPLSQCFKCLKFNHSAKVCRGEQMCSSCAGRHSYKECDVEEIVCLNCSGNHLAISRDCPVKQKKMQEKKSKYQNVNRSYATVVRDSECWMCYICQTRLQQCHRLQQLAVQTRGLVDSLCRNETDIDIGAIRSLLELSIYKKKNISTTHPTADNIKEEPDIKTEQYNECETIEEQTVENTNTYGEDYAPVLEFEDDDVSDSDAVCKQESLSVDRIDAWQGSRVLELKLVKLSQSVIDKYVRQSPPTQHTATEEHVGDNGEGAGEQSVENEDKKAQYKSHKEQLICDVCLKMFPTKSRLLRHIRTHTGEKTFSCNICQKKFKLRSNLERHLVIHTGEKPFNCDICQKKFGRKDNLQTHLLIHTGEKPYNCRICHKKFATKSHLKEHMLIHTGEKLYNCDICQKKFLQRSHLKKHLLIHTGEKPYNCDICQKKFLRKGHLKQHLLIHTGEKPYNCDICQKKFTLRSHLKRHLVIHTGEKPFNCNICQKKFGRKSSLQEHMLIHTCEKAYNCDICQKKFLRRGELKIHLFIHTGEKP